MYQQNKYSESKGKFRQASNHCKRVLETAKLAYANKTKESMFSTKVNLLYLLYTTAQEYCFVHLIKPTLILMTHVSLYLFTLLELI